MSIAKQPNGIDTQKAYAKTYERKNCCQPKAPARCASMNPRTKAINMPIAPAASARMRLRSICNRAVSEEFISIAPPLARLPVRRIPASAVPRAFGAPLAVRGVDAGSIAVHGTEPVGHHFKEVADWSVAQTLDVIRRGLRKASLNDHAPAATRVVVAGRAINVVPLATSVEIRTRNRKWKFVRDNTILAAGIEKLVQAQVPTRDGSGNRLTF